MAVAVAIVLLLVVGCGGDTSGSGPCRLDASELRWIGAWAAAPSSAAGSFRDQSLRMIVHPSYGGDALRVRFTHRLGSGPVTLAGASVGLQAGGAAVEPGSLRRLLFDGEASVVLRPGQDVLSDPVELTFAAFENLAVSFHVEGEVGGATRHDEAVQTSYVADEGSGDRSGDASGEAFARETTSWYFLAAVDVLAPAGASAVVAVGDSITDGFVGQAGNLFEGDPAVRDLNLRYPDFLARRLAAGGRHSVLNLGIGGNRLLRGPPLPLFADQGPSLLSRLDADALAQSGVENAIVLIGTNDLGLPFPPVGAEELIAGLAQVVARLQAAGLHVLLGTQTPASGPRIGPFGHGSPAAIAARNAVNEWVRTESGADAVVDFHAALRDPGNPDAMRPGYDSGDGLHPSPAGYEAMAAAVDLSALRCGERR